MWLVVEPLHAVTYFARESMAAWEAAGLRGFWRGYFATRAAPLGPVGPEIVTATFFNFAPSMVTRALPDVWTMASPGTAVAARSAGATDALERILADAADPADVERVAAQLRGAVAGCPTVGRALFAANTAVATRSTPLASLWQVLTDLREHRGDGHCAALVAAGLDGCSAHVLASAVGAGGADRATRQPTRGWTDEAWAAASEQLRDRGLLDGDGGATRAGRALHAEVESRTDELAMGPWRELGPAATAAVEAELQVWASLVVGSGVIPFPNPMGLPPLSRP